MTAPEETTAPKQQQGDLLPWADPYICQLIEKLQREVRAERQAARRRRNPRLRDHQPRWDDSQLSPAEESRHPRLPR